MSAMFKGAIPGDPIASKVGEKVDPLYEQHKALTSWDTKAQQRQQANTTTVVQNSGLNQTTTGAERQTSLAVKSLLN